MPVVIAWMGEMLLTVIGQLVFSALVSLGIGIAASAAFNGIIDTTAVQSMLASGGAITDYLGWFGVDQFMTITLSAWAGRRITDAARIHFASLKNNAATSGGSD